MNIVAAASLCTPALNAAIRSDIRHYYRLRLRLPCYPLSLKAAVALAAGQFDVSGLFILDKATREAAAAQLAVLAQKEGPKAF